MARSLSKGQGLGKPPPCLICMGPGRGGRAQLHLPGGVSVWLCEAHRSPAFQRRRAGRDLVAGLMGAWRAAGCFSAARAAALDGHLARLSGPGRRRARPGSYAWPALRAEAEARFAAGERPAGVIGALRERHRGGPARAPSRRTMMRWFGEGRWLGGGAAPAAPPAPPAPSGRLGPTPRRPDGGDADVRAVLRDGRRPVR